MVSKLPWLEESLERGIEVLIYNGNLVITLPLIGTLRVRNSDKFSFQVT